MRGWKIKSVAQTEIIEQLTLACYSQKNDATWLLYITSDQILDKTDIITSPFTVAADTGDETLC